MKNPNISLLIVEDDPYQQDLLCNHLKAYDFITIVDILKTGEDLLKVAITNNHIDALFLDIQLGEGRNGLDSYSVLRFRGINIPAILVTGTIPEASFTYDLGIIDILEKPFTSSRFKQSIEKLSNHINFLKFSSSGGFYIPIYNDNIFQVTPNEVLFIESINRMVLVHTTNDTIETKIPLKVYEQYLSNHFFYMTHRSFLVNFKKIKSISNCEIDFEDDTRKAIISEDKEEELKYHWETIKRILG
jgi:DNA-binding LytR/AlgR family response regulator